MWKISGPGSRTWERRVPLILIVFGAYAVFRTTRSVTMLYPVKGWDGHDLRLIYETWQQFISHDQAPKAFEKITYLPYVWWCLTPLFWLKWPLIKALACLGNFALAFWVCRRVSNMLGLDRIQSFACTIFFFSWLSTGLVIGLENLVLLSLACAIAAGQAETIPRQLLLVPAAFKHSITFPIFLHGILRRPVRMLLPCSILAALFIAAAVWAHVSPEQMLAGLKAGQAESHQWMEEYRTSCLLPALQSVLGKSSAAQVVTWLVSVLLAAWFIMKVKDPHVIFAGLLLLSMLPLYHRNYDMIVALPTLGLMLKHRPWFWSVGLSLALCGAYDSIDRNVCQHFASLSFLSNFYYPTLVVALIASLVAIDQKIRLAADSAGIAADLPTQHEQTRNLLSAQ